MLKTLAVYHFKIYLSPRWALYEGRLYYSVHVFTIIVNNELTGQVVYNEGHRSKGTTLQEIQWFLEDLPGWKMRSLTHWLPLFNCLSNRKFQRLVRLVCPLHEIVTVSLHKFSHVVIGRHDKTSLGRWLLHFVKYKKGSNKRWKYSYYIVSLNIQFATSIYVFKWMFKATFYRLSSVL